MSLSGPGEIRIRRRELTVLRRSLLAALPQEGCTLLLGERCPGPGEEVWLIRLIWPCLNVWMPAAERDGRFQLDPREQLLAQRWARQRNMLVLGSGHSHPRSAAIPSDTDLELAFTPALQLILSPLEAWQPACWWLVAGPEGPPTALPLQWRMVD